MRVFPRFPQRAGRHRRTALAVAVLVAGIAFPLGALASHQFGDVPDSNTFHADIDAIADAGVTTGCGGGNYCPKSYVTREQMAAFLNRLGALGPGKTPVVNADRLDGLDSSNFVNTVSVFQGSYTCPGVQMMPTSDDADWALAGYAKYFVTGTGGALFCGVLLPNGATITGVYALIYDANASYGGGCNFRRVSTVDGTDNVIGSTTSSGNAYAGGNISLGDTVLSNTLVDNGQFMYIADCVLTGSASTLRVRGVAVTYDITGLPEW